MNKKLLAAAVSAAVMAPVAAHAESSFYARVNNAIAIKDDGTDSSTNLSDVAGRFGVKGSTDIGNGLTVSGQFEFRAKSDDDTGFRSHDGGGKAKTNGRVAKVGISGGFGSVSLGQQWSAYFDTFGTLVSPTYSLGYYLYSSVGGGPYRTSDTIKYSNSFGPVYLELDYRSNGGDGTNAQDKNGYGIGLTFAPMDNLTIALAYDNQENGGTAAVDAVKAVAAQSLAALRTELVVDHAEFTNSNLPAVVNPIAEVTGAAATATKPEVTAVTEVTGATYLDELKALLPSLTTAVTTAEANLAAATTGFGALHTAIADAEDAKEAAEKAIAAIDASGAVNQTDLVRDAVGEKAAVVATTADDRELTGIAVKYNFGAVAVTLGHQEKEAGDAEVDTDFVNLSGNISEKTNWLVMFSQAENQDGLETDQVLWGIYHNLGGGLRLYYEATTVEDDADKDISHHLLGMRVDF